MTQSLTFLCATSMYCIVNTIHFLQCCEMQRNTRLGSDSIFASAALHFINQVLEFYHNATDAMQGFVLFCEPSQMLNALLQ